MQVALLGNPFAVEQHLQGGTQGGEAKTLVFHFNDDRVVVGISNVGQVIQTAVRDRAGAENRLAVLEEVEDLVVAHFLSHVFPFQFPAWLLASPSTLRSPTVALSSLKTRQQIPTQLATGPLNFSPATKLSDSASPRCTYPASSPAHPTANPLRAR